ncbi:MAG: hypothetical protein ACLFOY_11835 [Desulfatibacillaceae bacterium]
MKKPAIIITLVIVLLIATGFGLQWYADREAKRQVDAVIAEAGAMGGATYEDVHVDLFGPDLYVRGVEVYAAGSTQPIPVREFVLHGYAPWKEPERTHFEVRGMRLAPEENIGPRTSDPLTIMGYDELLVNLEVDYDYDREARRIDAREITLDVEDMGRATLSFVLDGYAPLSGRAASNPMALAGLLMQVRFVRGRLVYEDQSLFERLKRADAALSGPAEKPPVELIMEELDRRAEAARDERIAGTLEALRDFIGDPGALVVSAEPEQPVSYLNLRGVTTLEEYLRVFRVRVESTSAPASPPGRPLKS